MRTGRLLYTQLLIVLLSGIAFNGYTQVDFHCSQPLSINGANHITNPIFSLNDLNYLSAAFIDGNVPGWGSAACGTADISGYYSGFARPNPLPSNIPWNVQPPRYASMAVLNSYPTNPGITYTEGLSTKIRAVKAGQQYAFSFFLANRVFTGEPGASYVMKAILTNCSNISPLEASCSSNAPTSYPVLPRKQEIFCARYDAVDNPAWQQIFITFTATEDWDMLVIYPETIDNDPPVRSSWVHLAYPELVPLSPFLESTSTSCTTSLRAGGVINAEYTWTDSRGNVIGNTPQIYVNNTLGGQYSVTMHVPSVVTNNTCSNNNVTVTTPIDLPPCTPCNNKLLTRGVVTYYYNDGTNDTGDTYKKDLLLDCTNDMLCQGIDEAVFTMDLASGEANGNTWSIFRDGIPVTDPQAHVSFHQTYPTTQQTYNPTFTFIDFRQPTTFEFRLNNSVQNSVESFTLRVLPRAEVSGARACWSTTRPGYVALDVSTQFTTRNTRYIWDFSGAPSSFTYVQPSINDPDIEYSFPASTQSFEAKVRIVNSEFGCDNIARVTLFSQGGNCSRMAVSSIHPPVEEKKTSATILFPNPVTSSFTVKSDKRISHLTLYGAEGKLLKRFLSTDIHKPLQVDELSAGVYWVLITYADHSTETKRIVKPNNKQ